MKDRWNYRRGRAVEGGGAKWSRASARISACMYRPSNPQHTRRVARQWFKYRHGLFPRLWFVKSFVDFVILEAFASFLFSSVHFYTFHLEMIKNSGFSEEPAAFFFRVKGIAPHREHSSRSTDWFLDYFNDAVPRVEIIQRGIKWDDDYEQYGVRSTRIWKDTFGFLKVLLRYSLWESEETESFSHNQLSSSDKLLNNFPWVNFFT
jgi:hypothetical protein